jgi:hypothetical protein
MGKKNPAPMSRVPGGNRQSGIVWRGLEVLANNINRRGVTLNMTRRLAMERLATEMEEYARENAPWTDRTGNARDLLRAQVVHNEALQSSTAFLGHGVEYGVWLEIMGGGEFAIVGPTIEYYSSLMMSTVVEVDSFSDILGQMSFAGDGEGDW